MSDKPPKPPLPKGVAHDPFTDGMGKPQRGTDNWPPIPEPKIDTPAKKDNDESA